MSLPESTPIRIVMAPKTKRAVALGLAVEAYDDYFADQYNPTKDQDEKVNGERAVVGRWADSPTHHANAVVEVAEVFLAFLDADEKEQD